jgi:hypothetical protein
MQNGWLISDITGHYGTNYHRRAFIAAYEWPANLPEDAIYPSTNVDSNGKDFVRRKQIHTTFCEKPDATC